MPDRELAPTRIALLELGEERATAREGYALLDEKRMMLAARMLALLARHADECGRWRALLVDADAALAAAFDRHGVRDLEQRPRGDPGQLLAVREERLLGVRVPQVAVAATLAAAPAAVVDDSPEAQRAAAAFRALLASAPPPVRALAAATAARTFLIIFSE